MDLYQVSVPFILGPLVQDVSGVRCEMFFVGCGQKGSDGALDYNIGFYFTGVVRLSVLRPFLNRKYAQIPSKPRDITTRNV